MSGLRKQEQKGVPFRIDRAQRANLADQIAEGFGHAIMSGYYKAGERLPTVRELVRYFSVSSRDVVAAVARLAAKGLVESVPHRGVTIRARAAMPIWKGRVLCVVASGDFSYGIVSMVGRLRETISRAGYLFTQVTALRGPRGVLDVSGVEFALNQPLDLVILMSAARPLLVRVKRSGVPFVSERFAGAEAVSNCRGVYHHDASSAHSDFVRQCFQDGVKDITIVCKGESDGLDAGRMFRTAGLKVRTVTLRPQRVGAARLEILRRTGYNAVADGLLKFGDGKCRQFFFTDDHVATGAMMALAERGCRMPGDLRLAMSVNAGNRPVAGFPYDTFESDPFADGDRLARLALRQLGGEDHPFDLALPVTFVGTR